MQQLLFPLMITALMLSACGGNSTDQVSKLSNNVSEKNKTGSSCLAEHAMEPCNIFDLNQIAGWLEMAAAELEQKGPPELENAPKLLSNPMVRYCNYNWSTGRKQSLTVGSRTIEVDKDNTIGIGGFKLLDKEEIDKPYGEYFDNYYRTMTDEEVAAFHKKVEEEMEEESEQVKSAAKTITSMIPKSFFTKAEGIGDKAVLEGNDLNSEARVHTLHGNIVFTVISDLSENFDENATMAKRLAKEAVASCN
ncbi:hypothetical protein [Portibacter marinus]|uniref:hypothetical protein n=1 Tax=Portibacter marinus TaxID=2898660 RepID=UPI001F2C911B|nr:hypothetical protein [Portibacter marinus]